MSIEFSDFEQDALLELFNLGIGRAADALSRMVHDEVRLSVPHIKILDRTEASQLLSEHTVDEVAAIRQIFHGHFHGTAMLIYPESQSLELVRSLLGNETPLENITEMEQEGLLEVGNVILNACLGTFSNMMDLELRFDLPEYFKGAWADVLHMSSSSAIPGLGATDSKVILLIVDFIAGEQAARRKAIKGFVILLLDMNTIADLKKSLVKLGELHG